MNMKDNRRSILRLLLPVLASTALLFSMAAAVHAQKGTQEKELSEQLSQELNRTSYPHCDSTRQEQRDLSGTYTGKVNYPEVGMVGDATFTITGNKFTLKSDKAEASGRVTAVTTCGYTAIALMFGEPGATNWELHQAATVSVTARRQRGKFLLKAVAGEKTSFMFQCDCSKCKTGCECCAGF
jgi:hypothetical protein